MRLFHASLIAGAAVAVWLTNASDHWSIASIVLLAAFTIAGALTDLSAGPNKLRISGGTIGLIEAAVLFGPGPAAILGAATQVVAIVRTRAKPHIVVANVASCIWFPLAAALLFHATVRLANLGSDMAAYYLLVFAAYIVGLVVNIISVFGYRRYLYGTPMSESIRQQVMPLMSAQLVSGLLTMGAAFVVVKTGTMGIVLTALVLLIFQYLIGELLKSKARGERLHHIATTDELTGLANRERFRARLDQRIASANETDEKFAVMLLDLDRFKEVNDTLGHHFGDELLRDLGPRLAEAVGPDGLVARLGGDEFAVMPAEATGDTDRLEAIARGLIRCVQQPVVVDDLTLDVGVSIGVARFPRDGHDPHSLLRSADVAMYAAKEAHSGCKVYAAALDRHSVRRLSVLSEFRRALDSDEIVVFYQPLMEMDGTASARRGGPGALAAP